MAGIEQFVIDCDCGAPMTVGVHQCGLQAVCPKCRKTTRVPDLKKLRAQSGDPYPTLASIRKIQKAIDDRLAPFDGRCLNCQVEGTTEVPVVFEELRERFVTDHGGFRLGVTGLGAVKGKAHDVMEQTEVPLVFCDQCAEEFEASRPTRSATWAREIAILVGAGIAFELVFRFWQITLFAVALFAIKLWQWRQQANARELRRPRWLDPWIAKVRWFPEAIRDAMEYSLKPGRPRSLRDNA